MEQRGVDQQLHVCFIHIQLKQSSSHKEKLQSTYVWLVKEGQAPFTFTIQPRKERDIHAKEIKQVSRGKEPDISNIFTQKKVVPKKTAARKKPISQYRTCLLTYLGITDIPDGGTCLIPMNAHIFGFEYMEAIGREDMDQIFKHLELGLSVISIYIKFPYDKVMRPRGLEERFTFLAPNTVNAWLIKTKPDDVIAVLQAFRSQRDIQVPKSRANNITWIRVQCPSQRNGIDCGYFILRFMKETLLLDLIEISSTYFDEFKRARYSKDQLDKLMEEWCQLIMELRIL
ncbi:uncharacterized protein LOC131619890 [Vicia villosa]|uniref:uncharacterized protein LOC131619890 n=1 Tax=Vicia villosa TaxID=3911 RepID=UPI00273C7ADC|nr:uncharacterized protein LOC131619890 [Vicia villosa]